MKGGVRIAMHLMKGGVILYIRQHYTAEKGGVRVAMHLMKGGVILYIT